MEYSGYRIQHDGTFGMYTIKPIGKGAIPKTLRGRYTSYGAAKQAIDAYVKTQKGVGNGEADGTR